jgi:predicted DNA-binding transcriptional regulator AlpA
MKFENSELPDLFGSDTVLLRLLSRADVIQRWRCGSHSFFQRAEMDELLTARRHRGRPAYSWLGIWIFEGGLPPQGLEEAYQADLMTAAELAQLCPLGQATILREAVAGRIPHRRIGRVIRFVPAEAAAWLKSWT